MAEAVVLESDYGEHEDAMVAYRAAGEARALALGNRGPVRYEADGSLHRDIVESYWEHGFYVFQGVIGDEELADIERDVLDIVEQAPTEPQGKFDKHGRPALGSDGKGGGMALVRPLSDPIGGTERNNGRHPAKMIEPELPEGAPEWVLQVVGGSLQFSDAALRLYAHPDLMRVAEAFNGDRADLFSLRLRVSRQTAIASRQPHLEGIHAAKVAGHWHDRNHAAVRR